MSVVERIDDYLRLGGLFNPEMMDSEVVRELLMDAKRELTIQYAVSLRLKQRTEGLEALLRRASPESYSILMEIRAAIEVKP